MTREFRLFEDFGPLHLPLDDGSVVALENSYSQWSLWTGTDFDLTAEIDRESDADFQFVAIIGSLTGAADVRRIAAGFRPGDEAAAVNSPDTGEPVEAATELVARLPVRARSVPGGDFDPEPRDYEKAPNTRRKKTVVVGIIDDAVNIANRRFRAADGMPRVDYAWVQDADAVDDGTVPFGREWMRSDIVSVLEDHAGDEDACLQALQLVGDPSGPYRTSLLRGRVSHGTHVADLAAGADPNDADAVNRRLVTVQLPVLATQDTSGVSLIASVIAAARYIFDRARAISDALGVAVPVVLNFSYGFYGGPHDGQHILERALQALAQEYRDHTATLEDGTAAAVEIVMPAGNAHLTRTHASTPPSVGDTSASLEIAARVQPQDRTSSYIEFWFPRGAGSITLEMTLPGADSAHAIAFDDPAHGQAMILALPDDRDGPAPRTVIARIRVEQPNNIASDAAEDAAPYWRVLVALAPTLVLDIDRIPAPHGTWLFTASADIADGGQIHAWIQRDESVSGLATRGRQTYFDDDAHEAALFDRLGDVAVSESPVWTSAVRRDGTVSGIATSAPDDADEDLCKSVVVGGYHWRSGAAAVYSAAGAAAIPAPLVMAASDTSRVLSGILATGTRSESRVALNGTSVAAPQVTRLLADLLSDLGPQERAGFNSDDALTAKAHLPPRPDDDSPELASSPVIREERVKAGLLDPNPDQARQIERDRP